MPADRVAENRAGWQAWNAARGEDYGIRTAGGKVVDSAGVIDADGPVRAASMVEFDSLDEAVRVAQGAPNLRAEMRQMVGCHRRKPPFGSSRHRGRA